MSLKGDKIYWSSEMFLQRKSNLTGVSPRVSKKISCLKLCSGQIPKMHLIKISNISHLILWGAIHINLIALAVWNLLTDFIFYFFDTIKASPSLLSLVIWSQVMKWQTQTRHACINALCIRRPFPARRVRGTHSTRARLRASLTGSLISHIETLASASALGRTMEGCACYCSSAAHDDGQLEAHFC